MLFSLLLASVFARPDHEQASTMFRNQMPGWKENEVSVEAAAQIESALRELVVQQRRRNQWLMLIAISGMTAAGLPLLPLFWL